MRISCLEWRTRVLGYRIGTWRVRERWRAVILPVQVTSSPVWVLWSRMCTNTCSNAGIMNLQVLPFRLRIRQLLSSYACQQCNNYCTSLNSITPHKDALVLCKDTKRTWPYLALDLLDPGTCQGWSVTLLTRHVRICRGVRLETYS